MALLAKKVGRGKGRKGTESGGSDNTGRNDDSSGAVGAAGDSDGGVDGGDGAAATLASIASPSRSDIIAPSPQASRATSENYPGADNFDDGGWQVLNGKQPSTSDLKTRTGLAPPLMLDTGDDEDERLGDGGGSGGGDSGGDRSSSMASPTTMHQITSAAAAALARRPRAGGAAGTDEGEGGAARNRGLPRSGGNKGRGASVSASAPFSITSAAARWSDADDRCMPLFFEVTTKTADCTLVPGVNTFKMTTNLQLTALLTPTAFHAQSGSLRLCCRTLPECNFAAAGPRQDPAVTLDARDAPLLVGMPQSVSVRLKGVPRRARNVRVVLKCADGLQIVTSGGNRGSRGSRGSSSHLELSEATIDVESAAVRGRVDAGDDLFVPIQLVAAHEIDGNGGNGGDSAGDPREPDTRGALPPASVAGSGTASSTSSLDTIDRVLTCTVHFESLCSHHAQTAKLLMHFYHPFKVDYDAKLTQNGLFATVQIESSVPCPLTLRGRRLVPIIPSFSALTTSVSDAANALFGGSSAVGMVRVDESVDYNANLDGNVVLQPGQRLALLWKLELDGEPMPSASPSTIYHCSCELQLEYVRSKQTTPPP